MQSIYLIIIYRSMTFHMTDNYMLNKTGRTKKRHMDSAKRSKEAETASREHFMPVQPTGYQKYRQSEGNITCRLSIKI